MNKPPKPEDSKDGQQEPGSLRDKDLRDPLADLMPMAKQSGRQSDMESDDRLEPTGVGQAHRRSEEANLHRPTSNDRSKADGEFDVALDDSLDPFVGSRERQPSPNEVPEGSPNEVPEGPTEEEVERRKKQEAEKESARRIAFAEQFLEKPDKPSTRSKREPKTRDLVKAVMPMRLNTARFQKQMIVVLGCVVLSLGVLVAWKLAHRPSSTAIGASLVGENQPEDWEEPEKSEAEEAGNKIQEEAPEKTGPKENTPAYFFGKGVLEHQDGKLSRAEHFFRKALELDERHPGATAGLASVLVADGFLEEAQGVLQDLEEFVPDDALLELNQGLIEYQLGNKSAAQDRLRRFLSLTPEGKHAHDVKLILTHLFKKPDP